MRLELWAAPFLVVVSTSVATAQSISGLVSGMQVHVRGDRATNEGARHFTTSGIVASADSTRIVLRSDRTDARLDTIALVGVRRLDVFDGRRPRRDRVLIGGATAGLVATGAWFLARQTLQPESYDETIFDRATDRSVTIHVTGPAPVLVKRLRNSIPVAAVVGGLLGSVIGAEKRERIPIPQSVFSEAR